jgi:class 3 adenylate cyclase
MPDSDIAVDLERGLAGPPALVWALAADSNRVDRVLGAGRVTYRFEGEGDERLRIGSGRAGGGDSSWVEHGEWIEGRFIFAERRYLSGVFRRAGFRVEVTPATAGATHLAMRAWLAPVTPPPDGGALLAGTMRAGLTAYLDGLAAALARMPRETAPGEAAAVAARRALSAAPAPDVVTGRRTPVDEAHLAYCASRLAASPVTPALRERLLELVRTRADEELRQMRPYELARVWGEAPRAVLGAFLHAARAGLVDLRWELGCPTCRVAAGTASSLAQVRRHAHCEECEIDFELDFSHNVEAVFQVSPGVRAIDQRLYCGGSPWWRPHVLARFEVPAGATRDVDVPLPSSVYVRTPRPRALAVLAGAEGVRVAASDAGVAVEPTPSGVRLENASGHELVVTIERADLDLETVTGADVMTMPEFHDLFATDAPATGVDLTVGSITVLFSDLTDTTGLYERLGDARAFALIEDHFQRMAAAVAAHQGAMVKTMGDAVMAVFGGPAPALAAALRMVEDTQAAHGAHGLALKVGLHAGPSLVVRANARLDFFGGTVNLAARLQAHARAGEVAIADELLAHAGVAALVAEHGLVVARERVVLKGLREARAVAVLRRPDGPAP